MDTNLPGDYRVSSTTEPPSSDIESPTFHPVSNDSKKKLAYFIGAVFAGILVSFSIYVVYQYVAPDMSPVARDVMLSVTPTGITTETASPTQTMASPTLVQATPTKTVIVTNTPVPPTATAIPQPTNTPVPPTNTPVPPDTTTPSISMTGPSSGSTVSFNNFCFPVYATDNQSSSSEMTIRHRFDSGSWTDWGTNWSPCFSGVSNGQHTFTVEVRDKAGNVAQQQSTFTVQS